RKRLGERPEERHRTDRPGRETNPLRHDTGERHVTASDEAVHMASTAALAAADKKASDVRVLDVSDRLVITDCFVIASGRGERRVEAIVGNVEERLRAAGYKPARREGVREGRWALLDYVEMVVHVQHSDEREYYALERLWKDCPAVEVAG